MPARPTWKGYLKISLVNIPIKVFPATDAGATLSFNQLHGECQAGIGKVALYGREYLVKVQPREQGLIMYTLRHANEIRSMDAIDELTEMPEKVRPEEVKLAKQVMGTFEGEVDLQEYRDDYQVGL